MFGALYYKKLTKAGTLACMISGLLATILWGELGIGKYFWNIYSAVPCTIISTIFMVVVSEMTTPPKEAEEDFALMNAASVQPATNKNITA